MLRLLHACIIYSQIKANHFVQNQQVLVLLLGQVLRQFQHLLQSRPSSWISSSFLTLKSRPFLSFDNILFSFYSWIYSSKCCKLPLHRQIDPWQVLSRYPTWLCIWKKREEIGFVPKKNCISKQKKLLLRVWKVSSTSFQTCL